MNYGCCAWVVLPFLAFADGDVPRAPMAASGGPAECLIEPLFSEVHVVSTAADGVRGIAVADLDGDLDVDILSASNFDDKIAWYESDGASVPSFTEHIITTAADGARDVFAIDLDGDLDVDVLSASASDDTIGWYENDGATPPNFSKRIVITTGADGARDVFAIDLDGDLDIDVLSASASDDTIAWYENDGATPPSFTEHIITTGADLAESVFAIDLDGDTDIDVLSASSFDDTIAWYENDGATPPNFTEHILTTAADGALAVFAVDLDNDLDIDVLSASINDDTIAWYENDGGAPPSFTEHIITRAADGVRGVFATDLDGDLDIDLLSALGGALLVWYRNDGATPPNFTQFTIAGDASGVRAAIAHDIDADGDNDVVWSSFSADKVSWHEMSEPVFGTCCLSDGSCLDAMCLADCADMLAWAWTPQGTCDQTDCPGGDAPAAFLVDNLNIDNFIQIIADLAAFKTRYWNLPGNDLAVEYLVQKLESFGYDNVVLDPYEFQGQEKFNVYATKIGTTRPLEMYILGAHLDSFNINGNFQDAPGADDDASGCASVLEMARVFANAQTDVSIRFVLWNNEETGLNGSEAYVAGHRDLQGTPEEPAWLGMIQQDMILYDHGPGKVPDADVEYQAANQANGLAAILASFVAGAMQRYGDMPAEVGDNMNNTDSRPFWSDTASISARENQRVSEIGSGSNPHWHQPSDLPETYSAEDYEFGFNIVKMVAGAVGELVNASPNPCPWDLDGSGIVGATDLLSLLVNWGTCADCNDCPADFDGNCTVGATDLLALLVNWGPCP
ncbi:MAG: M20/M25/M40 family metallo-hydrolase [Phycisphaerales bacterium]